MATELYFDTARLGRMCFNARKAEQDFSKLASQLGSSLYWEKFLIDGFDSLPASLRRRSTGLSCWSGLTGFRQGLADFVSLSSDGSVLLAGQSRTFISLAAECLFQQCNRVLATDLEWPPYLAVLKRAAVRQGRMLRVLPVRQRVLTATCDRRGLAQEIISEYFRHGCDGLFLSDITHTGVRIPYGEVLRCIAEHKPPRLTVIDGAQALGQRPVRLNEVEVDLYLAGTQKWFGAYHPLRLAFVAPKANWAAAMFERMLARRRLFDPLADFCRAVPAGNWSPFGETVNLTALLTAAGALAGWKNSLPTIPARWNHRCLNRNLLLDALSQLVRPAIDESLSAGIALFRIKGVTHSVLPSRTSLREALGREHIVASEPLRGLVRLAMPGVPLSPGTIDRLQLALDRIADTSTRQSDTVTEPLNDVAFGYK